MGAEIVRSGPDLFAGGESKKNEILWSIHQICFLSLFPSAGWRRRRADGSILILPLFACCTGVSCVLGHGSSARISTGRTIDDVNRFSLPTEGGGVRGEFRSTFFNWEVIKQKKPNTIHPSIHPPSFFELVPCCRIFLAGEKKRADDELRKEMPTVDGGYHTWKNRLVTPGGERGGGVSVAPYNKRESWPKQWDYPPSIAGCVIQTLATLLQQQMACLFSLGKSNFQKCLVFILILIFSRSLPITTSMIAGTLCVWRRLQTLQICLYCLVWPEMDGTFHHKS